MNGSNNEITNKSGPVSSTEPSMEEILASIRRILKEEQSAPEPAEAQPPEEEEEILVLDPSMVVQPEAGHIPAQPEMPDAFAAALREASAEPAAPEQAAPDSEALMATPEAAFGLAMEGAPHLASEPAAPELPEVANEAIDLPEDRNPAAETPEHAMAAEAGAAGTEKEISMQDDPNENVQPPHGLLGEAASSAAASSIGSLVRSISSERSAAIGRPGLTLEELVREELRPLLKSWLDSNLPTLVERIVRAEIERLVNRTGS